MTAKAAVYKVLDAMKAGEEFTGIELAMRVEARTGEKHFPSTSLRHMRSYRDSTGREIVNVNKRRSIYRIGEK